MREIGMKDDDVVVVEDISLFEDSTSTNKGKKKNKGGINNNKKKKGKVAKSKNKRRTDIVIPQTEAELRKQHSMLLSRVLDQMEREKLRQIRMALNNLSLKKTSAKEREPSKKKAELPEPVFNPPSEGLEGKAGRVVFPVVVGNTDHLYKSSKKSKNTLKYQTVRSFDLHGCTAGEAIKKLNHEMPAWTDEAMKEETYTIPVDIICGGGHQILSEVVEQWIRKHKSVANRAKGLYV